MAKMGGQAEVIKYLYSRIKDAGRRINGGARTSAGTTFLSYQGIGHPVWTDTRFDQLAQEGYRKNIIVYRCVTLIARSISGIQLQLYDGGEPLEAHPVLDLLRAPNPLQGYNGFCESIISYMLLAGNSYVHAVSYDGSNVPEELFVLKPNSVKIILGDSGFPEWFEYTSPQSVRRVPIDPLTGRSEILHFKMFHPQDAFYGMSPLEAARPSIDLHNAVLGHNLALMQNQGRPSGALIVRNQHGLTEQQRQRLREDLERLYAGKDHAGQMMVLEGDLDWREMGFSPKDLDFISGQNMAARAIAQAFGVPPMLVGVLGDATFSNYREARLHLWEDTILPILELFVNMLNNWLLSSFPGQLRLTYNKDDIPALAAKRENIWERIKNAPLTLNEKRREIGYPPLSDENLQSLLKQNQGEQL